MRRAEGLKNEERSKYTRFECWRRGFGRQAALAKKGCGSSGFQWLCGLVQVILAQTRIITCAKLPNRKAASRPVATKLVLQWRKIIIRAISAPLVAVKIAENVKL